MNPQPLATWQVNVPTFTPSACAGAANATAPAKAAPTNANPNFFDIPLAPWFSVPAVCRARGFRPRVNRARTLNVWRRAGVPSREVAQKYQLRQDDRAARPRAPRQHAR